jgi:hypothetical protein
MFWYEPSRIGVQRWVAGDVLMDAFKNLGGDFTDAHDDDDDAY